jgi:hypothetical protein
MNQMGPEEGITYFHFRFFYLGMVFIWYESNYIYGKSINYTIADLHFDLGCLCPAG